MIRKVEEDYVLAFVSWIGHDIESEENVIAQNSLYPSELLDIIRFVSNSRFVSNTHGYHG